jgi:uncharacterized protein (UPF0210 family)
MNKEVLYYTVFIKKLDDTSNNYEMIVKYNESFERLSKDQLKQIDNIVLESIEKINKVLNLKDNEV